LNIADAPRVRSKQANEILLLAGNNDALKLFDWMCAHAVRLRLKKISLDTEFPNSNASLAIRSHHPEAP
jgi:hypothetical protein